MPEQPPLNRSYVISYAANDRDFPTIGLRADPRVAGYRVPEDLSPHPDSKRYPNHVFTGSQPSNGDERVTHVYEILPSPWVPFTRYDDDLGPIQGRRRSVKNEGQVASLAADKRVTYEAREGSAIVYTENEEAWSIKVDEDGNSLFPLKDRDFYDASRGAVRERRQLLVPTGEEVGSLENVNGVITQTSYEPYNEYLSIKVVQTYKVDGPQLTSRATNNEGQLTTITTQRKATLGYIPPNPTATRTVEASSEDVESLVERITNTPSVFTGLTQSVERPDPIPQKFRIKIPTRSEEFTVGGQVTTPILSTSDLSRSEQQTTEFIKRTRRTFRSVGSPQIITSRQYTQDLGGGFATVTETYPFTANEPQAIEFGVLSDEIEDVGNGTKLRRTVKLAPKETPLGEFDDNGNPQTVSAMPILVGQEYDEALDIVIPYKQVFASPDTKELVSGNRKRVNPRDVTYSQVTRYDVEDAQEALDEYYWEIPDMISINLPNKLKSVTLSVDSSDGRSSGSGFGPTYSFSRSTRGSVAGQISYDIEQGFQGNVPTIRSIFFLPKETCAPQDVLNKVRANGRSTALFWPNVRPESYQITVIAGSSFQEESKSVSFDSGSESSSSGSTRSTSVTTIPPTIHPKITISSPQININSGVIFVSPTVLEATENAQFPTGLFLYQINASPYRFSYVRVEAVLVQITNEYV
jgi:hypothetical protein